MCIRTSDIALDRRMIEKRNEQQTERTRGSATRAMHYIALVKLARRPACFLHFLLARPKEDEPSELLDYWRARSHNAVRVLYAFSLLLPLRALLSYNAIYTGVTKVRIMSLRFYCFYPPPPFAREYDRVTLAALRNYFFTAEENECSPCVGGYFSGLLLEDRVKLLRIAFARRNIVTFLYSIYGILLVYIY